MGRLTIKLITSWQTGDSIKEYFCPILWRSWLW